MRSAIALPTAVPQVGDALNSVTPYRGSGGGSSAAGGSFGRSGSSGVRSRRTRSGRLVSYTAVEWRSIEPLARQAEEQARQHPERRDLFLCHAWEDRNGSAAALYELLRSNAATVWFSERDVRLGKSLLREIDRGLATSRIGLVLVTPALLSSLAAEGIADKELSVLLATDRVIPVAHGTTLMPSATSVPCWPRVPDWTPRSRP